MSRLLLMGVLAALAGACARPQPPPGGEPDRSPPGLVSASPEARSVITDLSAPVVFRFGERLRVRGFNRTFVSVMPGEPDDFQVDLDGNEIRVRREGGWLPNQIYLVIVRPGIEDRFGNKRTDPAELVFSTGPPVPPTALAGLVQERVSGQPARDALIEAVRRTDSTVYRAHSDSAAFFALRHAPYGSYDVRAFTDRNRNLRLDAGEPRSGVSLVSLGPGADTVTVTFELLPGDTTAPRLTRADAIDSMHVRLTFDDAIDAEFGLGSATLALFRLPDSTVVPSGGTFQLARAFELERARTAAATDTTRRGAPPPREPARPAAAGPARPASEPTVVVTLVAPLPPGQYSVQVSGIRNVNNLAGGGAVRMTVREARAPSDTTRAPVDTTRTRRR